VQLGIVVDYKKYINFIKFCNLDKTASENYAICLKEPSSDETMSRAYISECYSPFRSGQISFEDVECSRHLSSSETYSLEMVLLDIYDDR
jgi:hypothetical protein